MSNILLLRSPAETSPDPYESVLRDASHSAYSITVLETSFTNLPTLQCLITGNPRPKAYSGVIITSKRSCEAWTTALQNCLSSLRPEDDISHIGLKSSLAVWSKVPFYAVGKGTAAALRDFESIGSSSGIDFRPDIRGEASGTGEQLAHFILDEIKNDDGDNKNTLLYLTGDKNRDTIPKILSSDEGRTQGIELDALQVYETHGASNFEHNLNSLLQQTATGNWWIVFFAPSSSAFTYPILQKYFRFKKAQSASDNAHSGLIPEVQKLVAKVGAIGHVTSSYLEEELMIHVDAVAIKPTPEALLAAISPTAGELPQ
ncbi:tetrapyrrole biosynthesis, uroporphyrinogen III synthase [Macrolepiota fuliginosa MF-IS2]|uniref:Tetrapyrrole biosynthesis, uroporphyrinogen III synthase n=1 Tax=Macrolepiota fuliginosa MF-IS2 TaxID=1400762 RepID=A0A9P5X111_9AGAR|nr:tetrapyrrole biosynthesis, uroporphyrinogen III synthase [Macrolepiota fuliginosa MF-IS2]